MIEEIGLQAQEYIEHRNNLSKIETYWETSIKYKTMVDLELKGNTKFRIAYNKRQQKYISYNNFVTETWD